MGRCATYRDPHLFPGQAVDVFDTAWPGAFRSHKCRFVKELPGGKAWVIAFAYSAPGGRSQWTPYSVIVPITGMRVSQRPADPPELPEWAEDKEG